MGNNVAVGTGFQVGGSPYLRGLEAAREALAQVSPEAPSLALLLGADQGGAMEILRGAREALGTCPLLGCVSDNAPDPMRGPVPVPPEVVQVVVFASTYFKTKLGVGRVPKGDWERGISEAFQNSYVLGTSPVRAGGEGASGLYDWYFYRRPSLALVAMICRPEQAAQREQEVVSFLGERFRDRVPVIMFSFSNEGGLPLVFADSKIVREGIVMAIIKTDLQFTLDRFHGFEPLGFKLHVTRAEGRKVLEFNGMPALEEYLASVGDTAGAARGVVSGWGLRHTLAYRGRGGRYHLVIPEKTGADGSITLPLDPEPDQPLYPMVCTQQQQEGLYPAIMAEARRHNQEEIGWALVIRNTELGDLHTGFFPQLSEPARGPRIIEFRVSGRLRAYLPGEEWEGQSSHLCLMLSRDLDPMAMAAHENGRLLSEVFRLKDLNQKVFDGIGYGIALLDANRCVIHFNNTYSAMMGGSTPVKVGGTCPMSLAGDGPCRVCAAAEAIRTGTFQSMELCLGGEGDRRWIRVDAFPLCDVEGRIVSAIEVLRDVSELKRLALSLEQEKGKMEGLVKGIAETIYIVDNRMDLQFFHLGARPLPGGAEAEFEGRKCHEAIFNRSLPCPWCRVAEVLRAGEVVRSVAVLDHGKDEARYYQLTFSPWRDRQGGAVAAICLLVDITMQRRMEQQMIHSEKLRSLAVLSAGMAHELNNPLGAINFNLEFLKKREKDPYNKGVLESMGKDVGRINRIVGNLLTFSRTGSKSYQPLRLTEVIDQALDLLRVLIERGQVAVERQYEGGVPLISGNLQDLQQVFINLLSNALDAMPAGGVLTIGAAFVPHELPGGAARILVVGGDGSEDPETIRTLAGRPGWEMEAAMGRGEVLARLGLPSADRPAALVICLGCESDEETRRTAEEARKASPETGIMVVDRYGLARQKEPSSGYADIFLVHPEPEQILEGIGQLLAERGRDVSRFGSVEVHMSDTGMGISPEDLPRIFDPFFTTKDEAKGTGLGLSVVHRILENHSATISVASEVGRGTTFTLQFPSLESVAGPDRVTAESGKEQP